MLTRERESLYREYGSGGGRLYLVISFFEQRVMHLKSGRAGGFYLSRIN